MAPTSAIVITVAAIGWILSRRVISMALHTEIGVTEIVSYAGDYVSLNCSLATVQHRNFTVSWLKYNKPLEEVTYREFRGFPNEQPRVLVLRNLLFADAGKYTCIVNTSELITNWTFILTIKEPLTGREPSITTNSLRNKTVTYGKSPVFNCDVISATIPYVEWYFEITNSEQRTNASNSRTRLKQLQGQQVVVKHQSASFFRVELHLVNVTFKDRGWYVCRAFNRFGKITKRAFLDILPKPTLSRKQLEKKYMMTFGDKPNLPLALLIAMPVGILVIACAVLVRALEKSKQSCDDVPGRGGEGVTKQGRESPDEVGVVAVDALTSEENNNVCEVSYLVGNLPERVPSSDDHPYNALSSGSQSTSTPDDWPATSSDPRDPCYARPSSEVNSSSEALNMSPPNGLSLSSDALEMDWEGLDLKITESLELVKMPIEVDV